jgi:hypothetical protein
MIFLTQTRLYYSILFLLTLLALACQEQQSSRTAFSGEGVILTATGPLYEGENTAQGVMDISHVLSDTGQAFFTEASLTEFELTLVNGGDFSQMRQMTLFLVNESTDMQKVAVLNPVPKGAKTLTFQMAADQKGTASLLNADDLTWVLDFSLLEDQEYDLVFSARYKFEGTLKQK